MLQNSDSSVSRLREIPRFAQRAHKIHGGHAGERAGDHARRDERGRIHQNGRRPRDPDGDHELPGVVAEGRRVINNIQRAATLFLVKNIFSLFLSVISLFTDWPYPLQPMHLTVISALTIGIPSFFLAMEPNYDRVTGHFLRGVLRRAFPGGLTNVFAVLVCQAFMVVFDLPAESIAMVCAGILAVVGMMVLFQVCKPFGAFRRIVWGAMLVCLIVVFTCLGELFELRSGTVQTNLLMLTLLLMTPTVFFAIQRLFDWGEKIFRRVFRRETA